jgi:hypothetical protein
MKRAVAVLAAVMLFASAEAARPAAGSPESARGPRATSPQHAPSEATEAAQPFAWEDCVRQRNWSDGEKTLRSAIRRAVVQAVAHFPGSLDALVKTTEPLYYEFRVCKLFPAIRENILDKQEQERLTAWLLSHPDFTQLLLVSLGKQDEPAKAFTVVLDLVKNAESDVRALPALAVACAIVYDTAGYVPEKALADLRYFVRERERMAFDLTALPPELCQFLLEGDLDASRREEILKTGHALRNLDAVYEQAPLAGAPREPKRELSGKRLGSPDGAVKQPVTPEERARITLEVGRAQGIPCARMRLPCKGESPVAWVSYLEQKAGRVEWKETAGAHTEMIRSYPAVAYEPSSRRVVGRAELQRLAMLAGRQGTAEGRAGRTAARLVDLAEAAVEPENPAELLPGARGKDPESASAALILLQKALDMDPLSERPWRALAALYRRYPEVCGRVMNESFRMLASEKPATVLARYPEVRLGAFALLLEAVEDKEQRRALLLQMCRAMGAYPVESARLVLLLAAQLEDNGQDREAFLGLRDFALGRTDAGPAALDVLEELKGIGLRTQQPQAVIAVHEALLRRLPLPRSEPYAAWTMYYTLGRRLQALYRDVGRHVEAEQIDKMLDGLARGEG